MLKNYLHYLHVRRRKDKDVKFHWSMRNGSPWYYVERCPRVFDAFSSSSLAYLRRFCHLCPNIIRIFIFCSRADYVDSRIPDFSKNLYPRYLWNYNSRYNNFFFLISQSTLKINKLSHLKILNCSNIIS